MAMSRFILNNIAYTHQRSPLKTTLTQYTWSTSQLLHRFSTTTNHNEQPEAKEISVTDSTKKPKPLSPRRRRRRSLWSSENRNFPPSLAGLGNAIVEAATNMNKVLENLSPSRLIRKFKEKDESYIVKYQMPGLSKDDVKITIEDGILFIRGEHKEEGEGEGSDDDEFWWATTYGYYNTSLMLPEDAKVEEITAEMNNGVLHIIIPKDENKKKHIKEVHVG